ncbi:MAG TPA: hypothetical protein VGI39_39725 [Polyangiaceae bacterium]|jgi:hypothetical protein
MGRRVANVTDAHRPIPRECCTCHQPIGADVFPMDITDDDGTGGGKTERYCPSCFVQFRAPIDLRWAANAKRIQAIRCLACGKTMVDMGAGRCNACFSPRVLVLAKPGMLKGGPLKAGALRAS